MGISREKEIRCWIVTIRRVIRILSLSFSLRSVPPLEFLDRRWFTFLMPAVALLLGIQETLGFLVLLIFFLNNCLNHLELALPCTLLRRSFLDGLFGLRHVKDLKEVVYIEMVEIQRLQDDLTDHEIYIFGLQFNFLEKLEEIFLSDRILCVPALVKCLVDVLLIMGDQLCDLNKHLIFSVLLEELILTNHR